MDTGASASVVGKRLACKLGIWKRARKVKIRQEDGNSLGGNIVFNTAFKVMDFSLVLGNFAMDAEVLEIGNMDVILGLSWLTENRFSVDTQDRCLRNVNTGQVIPCSVRWIPEVLKMEEEPLEDSKVLVISNISERYSCYTTCLSAKEAARLSEHKSWDHQIPLGDPNTKIPTGAIYKTTWEEDEAL